MVSEGRNKDLRQETCLITKQTLIVQILYSLFTHFDQNGHIIRQLQ